MTSSGMKRLIPPGIVFGTQRIRGAYLRSIESLLEQAAQIIRLTKLHKPAQRSIRIGGCRVDENTSLRTAVICLGIDAFPNTCGIVAAVERQFPDEQMSDRMEQCVTNPGKIAVWLEAAP